MDLLQKCAVAFEHLLPYKYHFTIGRKGKMLTFTPVSYTHLDVYKRQM